MSKMVVCLCVFGVSAIGQTTFQDQAARLQNINAYLLDFRPASAPRFTSGFELILDINPQPSIDTKVGNKDEELDPPSIVPKLRGRYHHSSGLFLGAAFAPGIEFEDYEVESFGLELGYHQVLGPLNFRWRVSYSEGDVEGPITEPSAKDLFEYTNLGLDVSVGRAWRSVIFYGFMGWNDIETALSIEVDGVHLDNTDDTLYGGLGLGYQVGRFSFNLEQNVTDDYLRHVIASASYWF